MHKAYDRVNWNMLNEILIRFGFSARVLGLLSQCYSLGQASILLKGSIYGNVKLEWRLRQGNPISPYLFIIFVEFLSRLLFSLEREGKIHGIRLGRISPTISHLFFTDDILIFCRATRKEALAVARCLEHYSKWTGQMVNKAMLCKLGWTLETNIDLLWVKAVKGKYFPHSSFMRCGQKKNASWQWKSLLDTRPVLAKEMCFRVGKGTRLTSGKTHGFLIIRTSSHFPIRTPSSLRLNLFTNSCVKLVGKTRASGSIYGLATYIAD
ncbi:uncharacterized protein LOC132803749 [Ziziphus jujuba]|uniref:Uncharacterized protein LOC132803749 n=1 Tax=Ziziphus jujuba TaxID=326968 RepID=A0ABM4A933_ZIZJJ|nr:uncharacterized protein LOC132803749 [Ziziphus jujuba]